MENREPDFYLFGIPGYFMDMKVVPMKRKRRKRRRRIPTIAERLIDLADELKHPIGEVIQCDPCSECWTQEYLGIAMARTKLAQDFERQPKSFQLRAIIEEWDHERIVKELY